MIHLKGMTWDHPRGYDSMVATSRAWSQQHPGMEIEWHRRSLQAFGDYPLERLVNDYDLLVIDHPHVGSAALHGCLLPLDCPDRAADLAALAAGSIGHSHQSYQWNGHQWALAIDAAAQVMAWRPDHMSHPPVTWDDIQALATAGVALWPLKPIDAIMSFFSLAATRGVPCCTTPSHLIDPEVGEDVLAFMARLARNLPADCLDQSPIDVLEQLSRDHRYVCSPLLFCYSNYARPNFRDHLIQFGEVPRHQAHRPGRGILGGTGIAVSARTRHAEAALGYAFHVAGAECQQSTYFTGGGQPAHRAAWESKTVNQASSHFFAGLRSALDSSWLRPRRHGYLWFQDRAGEHINAFLKGSGTAADTMRRLQHDWCDSFPSESATPHEIPRMTGEL